MKKLINGKIALSFAAALLAALIAMPHAHAATQTAYINGKIAYTEETASFQSIWTRNGDGSNPVKIYTNAGLVLSPTWSPNGKQLAFSDTTGLPGADIYVINSDGSGKTDLTNNPARDEDPSWSPDGTKIAFISDRGRPTANYRLFLMNADGTNQVDISNAASQGDRFERWSPDGSTIYYSSARGGVEQTYAYNVSSRTDVQFSHISTSAIQPFVSPDGSKMVFAHTGTGDSKIQLYTEQADGSNLAKLFGLCSGGYSQYPSWSPDGKKLLFISNCESLSNVNHSGNIYFVNSDGSSPIRLTDLSENDWGPTDWHRVPVTTTTDDSSTGVTKIDQNDDHSDTDYEVYKKNEMHIAGKSGNIIVHSEGVLKGSGLAGKVYLESGGHVAPGNSPGCLSTGDLSMASGSVLEEELGGTTACSGYDQLKVTGTVTLNNPTLTPILYGGFVPSVGNSFTIINNDGVDAVSGTFNGMAEGSTFSVTGVDYKITYVGGDGNDVVITVVGVLNAAAAVAAAKSAPITPDTGLALVTANPLLSLVTCTVAASVLFAVSRRLSGSSR